jgi:hypothetical protein
MRFRIVFILVAAFVASVLSSNSVQAKHEGKVQTLLLGDSTTEGRVPR